MESRKQINEKKVYNYLNLQSTIQIDSLQKKVDKANKYTELAIQNYLAHGINTIISNFNITATLMKS